MAEKEGFDTPLAGERLQPLGHFSVYNKWLTSESLASLRL